MISIAIALVVGFALGVIARGFFGKNNKNGLAALDGAVRQAYAAGDKKVKDILEKHI